MNGIVYSKRYINKKDVKGRKLKLWKGEGSNMIKSISFLVSKVKREIL